MEGTNKVGFEQADGADVEKEVDKLGEIAALVVLNESSIDDLERNVKKAIQDFLGVDTRACQFPLS